MKKIFSIIIALFIFCSFAKAQTSPNEYNYITNPQGLKVDLEASRGIKQGYSIKSLLFVQKAYWGKLWRKISLSMLMRGDIKCGLIVEFTDSNGASSYSCIPAPNTAIDIQNLASKDLSSKGKEWDYVLAGAFVKLAQMKLY